MTTVKNTKDMMEKIDITSVGVLNDIRNNLPEATMTEKGLFGIGKNFFRSLNPDVLEYGTVYPNGFKDFYSASEPKKGYGIEIIFSGMDYWLKVLAYEDGDVFIKTGSTIGNSGWKKISFTN